MSRRPQRDGAKKEPPLTRQPPNTWQGILFGLIVFLGFLFYLEGGWCIMVVYFVLFWKELHYD